MRLVLSLIIATAVLVACGGPRLTSEQRAERKTNLAQTKAALSRAQTVQANGKTFRVAHVPERNAALVDLVGEPTPYFARDIEAAARIATGCNGKFDGGILSALGDTSTLDLAELRTKRSGRFWGWAVSLSC